MTNQIYTFPTSGNARPKHVAHFLGVHISTVWRYVHRPDFPQPQTLSDGVTVFDAAEVRQWNEQRLSQKPQGDTKGVRLAKIRAEKRKQRQQQGAEHA